LSRYADSKMISGAFIFFPNIRRDCQAWELNKETKIRGVRFEVFTAVTMKNGVLWDVTPRRSCKNRRFGGT
jgi:hypothetical protein